MKELLFVHHGGAGVMMGNSIWGLLANEQNVQYDGTLSSDSSSTPSTTLFKELGNGRYAPRSIFTDTESTQCNQVASGNLSKFFSPGAFTYTNESSCYHTRGYYTGGREMTDRAINQIRKEIEASDSCQGVVISSALSGGTSGALNRMLEEMKTFLHVDVLISAVFPSDKFSTLVVEPYNAALTFSDIEQSGFPCIMMQNEALYNICTDVLKIEQPTLDHVNRLIAHSISNVISPMVSNSTTLGMLSSQFTMNQFLQTSFGPLLPRDSEHSTSKTTAEIIEDVINPSQLFSKAHPKSKNHPSCAFISRGDTTSFEVGQGLQSALHKRLIQQLPQTDGDIMCYDGDSRNPQYPTKQDNIVAPSSSNVTFLTNSIDNTLSVIQPINRKLKKLMKRCSFMHWYVGEGIEHRDFMGHCSLIHETIEELKEISSLAFPTTPQ